MAGVERYLAIEGSNGLQSLEVENEGKKSLLELFRLIEATGIGDYCEFDPTIVRGLDYYTGIVFEIFDRGESMRAICGGGRYNNLLREFSGVDIPACGFGMGDVVLGEILALKGLLPAYKKKLDYYLVRVSDNELPLLLKVARCLRRKGFAVEFSYNFSPLKKQMARASRSGATRALIFGEDEISKGKLVEKNLETGEEVLVDIPLSGESSG
jgi:histidyl-tRNA synthetase